LQEFFCFKWLPRLVHAALEHGDSGRARSSPSYSRSGLGIILYIIELKLIENKKTVAAQIGEVKLCNVARNLIAECQTPVIINNN
jgi:hypothetical protein